MDYDTANPENEASGTSTATLIYILQALSFFVGITYLIALVINYLKLDDVRGTWVETHFRWQIRTFWWSLLWAIIGSITAWFLVGFVILGLNFIWVIYRIVRGWINLSNARPMYF